MAYTDGATQSSLELHILQCLRSGGIRTCQEVIRSVRHSAELSPAALAPKQSRNGEPQFHAIVRNSLEGGRSANLLANGYVECVERDGYKITEAGLVRIVELVELNDLLAELTKGQSFD